MKSTNFCYKLNDCLEIFNLFENQLRRNDLQFYRVIRKVRAEYNYVVQVKLDEGVRLKYISLLKLNRIFQRSCGSHELFHPAYNFGFSAASSLRCIILTQLFCTTFCIIAHKLKQIILHIKQLLEFILGRNNKLIFQSDNTVLIDLYA